MAMLGLEERSLAFYSRRAPLIKYICFFLAAGMVFVGLILFFLFLAFLATFSMPVQLHNLYGPTEAAVDVTSWHCQREQYTRTS